MVYTVDLPTGFEINVLCIDWDQVNHSKDFRGGIQKFWKFNLPYHGYSTGKNLFNSVVQGTTFSFDDPYCILFGDIWNLEEHLDALRCGNNALADLLQE